MGTRRTLSRATMGFLAVLVVGLLVAVFFIGRSQARTVPDVVVKSSNPTVTQLQRLGELVVLRASVADVLATSGYGYDGSWLIKGDALIAVDMRQAKFQMADTEAKKLVVLLPPPAVIQPRVDHEKTQTWDVKTQNWVSWIGGDQDKLRDESMRKAQRLVYDSCTGEEVMSQARSQTELMLTNMYRFIGWKAEVVWQDRSESPAATE